MEVPLTMRRIRTVTVQANKVYGHKLREDIDIFFKSELKRLLDLKNNLIEKNSKLIPDLKLNPVNLTNNSNYHDYLLMKNLIHESLIDDVVNWNEQYHKLIKDIQSIVNLFSAAAVRCNDDQDYRDAFPDELWSIGNPILDLKRTRDPGYMLSDFKILSRQFNEGVEILLYYQFNKLVY